MKILKKIISEHINYKCQIVQLAKSDLSKNYSGTVFGWIWALIRPLIFISIYYVAFTMGMRTGSPVEGFTFFQWLLAGVVPWFFMRDVIVAGAGSLRKYRYLVTKIKFPVSVIPTFVTLSELLVNIVLIVLMLVYFVIIGKGPDIYWMQLPLYIFMMFVFFSFWSIFASSISSLSRDFFQLLKSVTIGLFWLSGIIFDVSKVDNVILQKTLLVNPITIIVDGFRDSLIYKNWFWENPSKLIIFVIVTFVMLVAMVIVYGKLEEDIPDIL